METIVPAHNGVGRIIKNSNVIKKPLARRIEYILPPSKRYLSTQTIYVFMH
jgi:hypothetical protein